MSEAKADKIKESIAALEAQRSTLGDAVVDSAIGALREQLSQLRPDADKGATLDERKLVTILFADIAGFTALSEKLDPEEVRRLINACFDRLVPIVQKYGGTIDKFIGDEIMALFGAPIAHEDDPERALWVALEMFEAINVFNRAHNTQLGMHIGVNTGRVVAGSIGAKNRRDYSVIGDAVNLAARLEAASKTGEAFVGANTYHATKTLFDFEPVPPLLLEGREAPVEVRRLLGVKSERVRPRRIEGLRAPLTGRDVELNQIRLALANLMRGRGCMFSILGEAGLGKSRLIAETRALLPNGANWVEGRALSYTTGRNYWLVREILFSLLQLKPDDSSPDVAARLESDMRVCFGDRLGDFYPYLATVLELPLDGATQERVRFLSGEALQARILESLRSYVRARAARQPLLLVWEDLHWCDPSSLRALSEIAPLIPEVPLLLMTAARLEENPAAKVLADLSGRYPEHCRSIQLRPLSPSDSTALVEALLNVDNLPIEIRDLIFDRAEGNPFFIEELLRSLLDTGAITFDKDKPRLVCEIKALDVPETLEQVLAARIDRLSADQKATLQKASVIGRIFNRAVLRALDSGNGSVDADLDRTLDDLKRRQFIQSREQQASETVSLRENEFIFKHVITHEVAYRSLLLSRRKQLHADTGRALERLFPQRLDDLAATLGYHFERAEDHGRAADYLARAAERAKATFANTEAIGFYESAIRETEHVLQANDASEQRQKAFHLHEDLGDLFALVGEQERARAIFQRGFDFLSKIDIVRGARLYRKIGLSHSVQRHFGASEEALANAERILDEGAANPDPPWWEEKLQIQLERMQLFYWQGMVSEIRQVADRCSVLIDQNGSPTQQTRFLKQLALALLMESRFRPTVECIELAGRAARASEKIPDLCERCYVQFALGLIQTFHCDREGAVASLSAALELAERVGERVYECRSLTYLALAHRRGRDVDQARIFAERAGALAAKLAMTEYVAMAKANLAWVAWKRARLEDCDSLGHEALKLWHAMRDPYSMDWIALWPLIGAAMERQRTGDAIELAKGLFRDGQHPIEEEVMSATRKAIESCKTGSVWAAESDMRNALGAAAYHRYI